MTSPVGLFRNAFLLLVSLALSSCLPSAPRDEEKEPYFLAGKNHINAMDFKGAIESFEKAVEVNPKSAAAHFELGVLYDTKEPDPAAAIYHYERYLKLSPKSGKEYMVSTRILACKQQLAQAVSLPPATERQLEQLMEDKKRLLGEVEKWREYAVRLQDLTNQTGAAMPATRPVQSSGSSQSVAVATSPTPANSAHAVVPPSGGPRMHIVKAGETPMLIARRYGVRMEALMAANPKLDARRLHVGQSVAIPAP